MRLYMFIISEFLMKKSIKLEILLRHESLQHDFRSRNWK